ncbi:unnamed protein product [Paramecium sonneborni]|uniref:Mitochondrial cardiolipin hydrolase n=1 Tax=Paramecium sonneborni TaxID=65129 RepID=A0A8S1R5Y7_9CILI|nr:unnamed protein product [Paramecium sonneborni]
MSHKHSQIEVQHLFFPNEDNFSRFQKKLKKCKSTILGCIYQLTHSTIIEILVQLANQGCRVDLIMDQNSDEQDERKKTTIHMLLVMSGFKINISLIENKGLMHSKFCVIDKKITILGSANWTYQAFQNNFEHITIFKDSKTAKLYTEQFRVIWDQAKLAKYIDSQIIYQPNQNCVEFNKKIVSNKFGIKKRQFKIKFRKQKNSLNYKKKEQQLQNVTLPQFQQIQIKQNLPLFELSQIEEQKKAQTQHQNEILDFLENIRLHDEKKQNYSGITIQNENQKLLQDNKNDSSQYDSNPWQMKNQLFFPNIIKNSTKHKQIQKQEQNIIIIDDEDVEEVQIINDFSKHFL